MKGKKGGIGDEKEKHKERFPGNGFSWLDDNLLRYGYSSPYFFHSHVYLFLHRCEALSIGYVRHSAFFYGQDRYFNGQ